MAEQVIGYSSEYQILVLSECLKNDKFNVLVRDTVTADLFADKALQWYFDVITKSPVQLTRRTLKEELKKAKATKRIREDDWPRYRDIFKAITKPPLPYESEHLKNTLTKFIRTQNVKKAILETMDLVKEEKWDDIEAIMSSAVSAGIDVLSFGQDYFGEYANRLERREQRAKDDRLTTGVAEWDEQMNGGLGVGQVGMLAGGSGRGKSLALAWLAKTAVLHGKTVVYFTMELSEDNITDRLDAMMAELSPAALREEKQAILELFASYKNKYDKKFFIKEFSPGTTTVSALQSYCNNLHAQGIVPDLIIIDYFDLIKPPRYYSDNITKEADDVCVSLCSFAKDCATRIWTATQLNRAGMVAENPDETAMAGAISKLFAVDAAIFMAQTKEERELEEMRLIFIKNRNGITGRTVKINTDYGHFRFYCPPHVYSVRAQQRQEEEEARAAEAEAEATEEVNIDNTYDED